MAEMAELAAVQGKFSRISIPKLSSRLGILFGAALLVVLWFIPPPTGLSPQAWHLSIIFISTLIGIVANLLPMGALCILAIGACTLTQTLTLKQALSGFSSHIVWLILIAFILARGFIKTGLGSRIAYYFVLNMGKNTLGLAYGILATELLLAPFTPSNTARGAAIVYPIVSSLSEEYGSSPKQGTHRKIGSFLMKVAYQANVITSAMFITATAANPLVVSMAAKLGVDFTWTSWALAALAPGLLCLLALPALLYILYPPQIKATPEAPEFARRKLAEMGPLKWDEWLMLGTFGLLLTFWIFGTQLNIDATTAAFVGLGILLITGVLNWDDVLKEQNAWHTFIWLTTLLMLSGFLTEFGVMDWFSDHMQTFISRFDWLTALCLICLLYFYTHYAFASMTAHTGALFTPFALLGIAVGAPPVVTVLLLAFFSTLCASITHYGTGTAPVYFGSDYIKLRDWWRIGAILSVVNIVIWASVGPCWWKILGLW